MPHDSPQALFDANAALVAAVNASSIEAMDMALAQGADARAVGGTQKLTALDIASSRGFLEAVVRLIPLSDTERRDPDGGLRPLMRAAFNGSAPCVAALLPHCDPNAQDDSGFTALMWATQSRRLSAAKILKPRTDLSLTNHRGQTALMIAAAAGDIGHLFLLLLGSDARFANEAGETALMNAAIQGHVDCVFALLPFLRAEDIRAKNASGASAFAEAVGEDQWACVDILSEFATESELESAFFLIDAAGAENFPRWSARIEANALREEVKIGERLGVATEARGSAEITDFDVSGGVSEKTKTARRRAL